MVSRFDALVQDWNADNRDLNDRVAWLPMNTALRTLVLVCRLALIGPAPWVADALAAHALRLADPAVYPGRGNYALWTNVGLLAAGCATSQPVWTDLAARRIDALIRQSIDAHGVNDEGAVTYQLTNWRWYRETEQRLRLCGLVPPEAFAGAAHATHAAARRPAGSPLRDAR